MAVESVSKDVLGTGSLVHMRSSKYLEQLRGLVCVLQAAYEGRNAEGVTDLEERAIPATCWAIADLLDRLDLVVHGCFTADAAVDNPRYGEGL